MSKSKPLMTNYPAPMALTHFGFAMCERAGFVEYDRMQLRAASGIDHLDEYAGTRRAGNPAMMAVGVARISAHGRRRSIP